MSELLEIDGSILEGGGQILRISIALSAILGVPIKVSKIRAARSKPGLAAQHLRGIELVAAMCQARLKGAEIGSTEIEFIPGKIKGGQYNANIETAGSISLILQVSVPVALFADGPVDIDMRGGTNVDFAPQFEYLTEVFWPMLGKFGTEIQLDIHRRGYYPRGGGHVSVQIPATRRLVAVDYSRRGNPDIVRGTAFVAGTLPIEMAIQMREGFKSKVTSVPHVLIYSYKEEPEMAPDNGCGINVTVETTTGCILACDALGRRGKDSFELGCEVGEALNNLINSGACVDTHAQDQMIIYMALADGKSVVRTSQLTEHTKTAIHITEMMAKIKFNIEPIENNFLIECTGLGLLNRNIPPE